MRVEYPAVLLLLLLVPLVAWRRRAPKAVAFPVLPPSPLKNLRLRCLRYLPALRMALLALLVLAMAGPRFRPSALTDTDRGLAIEIVVDRSTSMSIEDMNYESNKLSRIDAVKRLSRDFIFGDGNDLPGRKGDFIGLISFAQDPRVLSPLTQSHENLRSSIDELKLAQSIDEDGTAIGEAIIFACARLNAATQNHVTGKLIVLITDGDNNLGRRPETAATIALESGIKIYSILIRPAGGDQDGGNTLSKISTSTQGLARLAKDATALRDIYREIDRLEPAQFGLARSHDRARALMWTLLATLLLLLADLVLRETWLRKLPE